MKKTLIFSFSKDPHADIVCEELERQGATYLRINTDIYPLSHEITYDSRAESFQIKDKWKYTLDDTWSIWRRRLNSHPVLPESLKKYEKNITAETAKTLQAMCILHRGLVVNPITSDFLADNKINLMETAKEFGPPTGVHIPDTMLTNNPDDLVKFASEHKKVAFKMQRGEAVVTEEGVELGYTSIVKQEHIEKGDMVRNLPCLVQEYVPKLYEMRINMIGEQPLGVAIYSQDSERTMIDWRKYDFDKVRHEKKDVPDNVRDFCVRMMKRFNLHFGAFDFIVTPDEQYAFLEVNPMGQWMWLEELTGSPVSKALANLLVGKES